LTTASAEKVLEINNLTTWFYTAGGVAKSVDGVSFAIERGKTLCVVGESGCGKSVTALSIMGLVPHPGKIVEGEVNFHGQNILTLANSQMAEMRGNRISMIFQDPSSALNPVHTVERQLIEVYQQHRKLSRSEARAESLAMLESIGIPDPESRLRAYPHELSGGMAQRVMIAMALTCEPEVLIADEPTTALDVTIQAQILDLMKDLQKTRDTATILITHDLGVVAEMADEVAVMYAGQVVEYADVYTLFSNPKHPYTRALLRSIPVLGKQQEALEVIKGRVPSLIDLPPACRFAARCSLREQTDDPRCTSQTPPLEQLNDVSASRCWLNDHAEGPSA
jgi:oligopeptide/dipeptide ABC transporter ATP-binding protein